MDETSRSAGHDVTGVVTEVLPSALYRVRLDAGAMVTAHGGPGAGGTVVNFVRLVVGERVRIELSPVDPGRGRIVRRLQG